MLKKTPLSELGSKMLMNSKLLDDMNVKLLLLGRRDKPVMNKDLIDGIDRVHDLSAQTALILRSVGLLMITVPHLNEQYVPFFALTVAKELELASDMINISLKELEYYYGDSKLFTVLITVG